VTQVCKSHNHVILYSLLMDLRGQTQMDRGKTFGTCTCVKGCKQEHTTWHSPTYYGNGNFNAIWSAWSNGLYSNVCLSCARKRVSGESSVRATSCMKMRLILVSSISPLQTITMLVVSSRWYCLTVWEAHRVFALELVSLGCMLGNLWYWQSVLRKVKTFRFHWACSVVGWISFT